MGLKKITENPLITDTVLFEITTPDASGCFVANPYKVDRVTIYYVERDFLGTNFGEYTKVVYNQDVEVQLEIAKQAFCIDPSPKNSFKIQGLQLELDSSAQKSTFYYKERITVKVIGSEGFPAWLSTDTSESPLTLINADDDGNPQFGHFTYEWNPQGSIREGDYFICWTWTPLPAGEKLSAHQPFVIGGDPKAVITIPTHIAPDDKYETLLERYLPELYKSTLTDGDITPETTDLFNSAVAAGFTFVENMANQIIDLFDANALHESLLVYLSNLFNLKLKSSDPTLWRRQIKEAIPSYKKKGTLDGLQDAFAQAGMELTKFTQYWQIVPPYTWTESFLVKDSASFPLVKNNIVTPIDNDNFGLWLKRAGTTVYNTLSKDYVTFEYDERGQLQMTWIGDELSATPVNLFAGDHVKILYQYRDVPGPTEQGYEEYVRALPLMDQRSEDMQEFPPKNWNVRLIAKSDPLFDVLIPVREPFQDFLTFGYVRNEFAYSENIYNMDEYNSSTRPSHNPCDIGKEFIDPCGACISSSYSVDVDIQELSNDRLLEAQEILRECVPFHARLHSIAFSGQVQEFIPAPVEVIDFLVTINKSHFIISGGANPFFHRVMEGGLNNWIVTRDDLTADNTVVNGATGIAYNDSVAFISPDVVLQDLGVAEFSHIMEILAPSMNAGTYTINQVKGNTAHVASSVSEPVDETAFTFNLSNILYGNTVTSITQDDLFLFSDETISFANIGVKSLWDIDHTPDYAGGAWKVSIPAYSASPYIVKDVVNGILQLQGDSSLPTSPTSGITYTLLNDLDVVIANSTTGDLVCERRGFVNLNDPYLDPIHEIIHTGDYLYYNGNEYLILQFDNLNFWIADYIDGNVAGATIQTRRRLARQQIGYFGYRGLALTTASDYESAFGIVNGDNPPPEDQITNDSHFKENFLIKIDTDFFKIAEIDGTNLKLMGRDHNWQTLTAGGTSVTYSLIHLVEKEVNIGFLVFDHLDRSGRDPVVREIFSNVDNNTAVVALSTPASSGVQENVAQEDRITFKIETRNGQKFEGDLS
jgi:hypothetical protein